MDSLPKSNRSDVLKLLGRPFDEMSFIVVDYYTTRDRELFHLPRTVNIDFSIIWLFRIKLGVYAYKQYKQKPHIWMFDISQITQSGIVDLTGIMDRLKEPCIQNYVLSEQAEMLDNWQAEHMIDVMNLIRKEL